MRVEIVAAVVLLVTVGAGLDARDDLSVLKTVHADYIVDGEPWEHALTLVREMVRTDTPIDDGSLALFASVLADNIQYVYHGHGVCTGLAQVIDCLRIEEEMRVQQRGDARGGRTIEQSSVRQGAMHVVRVNDVPHGTGPRLLDVYFVHMGIDKTVRLVEHFPTVRDPTPITWRPPQ